jgi:hypothetical protein
MAAACFNQLAVLSDRPRSRVPCAPCPTRSRGAGPGQPPLSGPLGPLFRSVLRLHIPHAQLTPSIPNMQRAVNQIAAAVLAVTKRLPVWTTHVPHPAVVASSTGSAHGLTSGQGRGLGCVDHGHGHGHGHGQG